jgi:hypothetical protein
MSLNMYMYVCTYGFFQHNLHFITQTKLIIFNYSKLSFIISLCLYICLSIAHIRFLCVEQANKYIKRFKLKFELLI